MGMLLYVRVKSDGVSDKKIGENRCLEKYTLPTFCHGCLLDLTTARRASSASFLHRPTLDSAT